MKMIGALLILLASTAIGRLYAMRYRDRPRELRQLRTALVSLETEIAYGLAPIGDAARRLAEQLPDPGKAFFTLFSDRLSQSDAPLSEVWRKTLDDIWPTTALKKTEKGIMAQFGATLGLSDRENQQKQIQLALAHLEREEIEAREAQKQYEKLFNSLGFLAGLLLAILLF
ncbi:stage III sporulation protein SpoIIIAB [Camelliibacillus cellulosilyticus]|uniref:Stage III sporulation protein SpoIIIAB n=1 Tax=Camelliibacillus cellulosilyticus TaxID=2174486 RepID=A0ABV9GM14_9BACL